jgi:hypothetical protein
MTEIIKHFVGNRYEVVLIATLCFYIAALLICLILVKEKKEK